MVDIWLDDMMKRLLIIGARGFGREIVNLARQCPGNGTEFEVAGYLDDQQDALSGYPGYPPIIASVESYAIRADDIFVCALGSTKHKQMYVEMIRSRGGCFQTLVHPTAIVSSNAALGEGCIVGAYALISCDVSISEYVTIQSFSAIGHDAKIGAYCHLNAYAFMGGFAELEAGVTLHTGAKVLPHKRIGANATVGAGSVVLRNVRPGTTVFGIPAMTIPSSSDELAK